MIFRRGQKASAPPRPVSAQPDERRLEVLGRAADILVRKVREGDIQLPLMPLTVERAIELTRDPTSSYLGLTAVIESDPALTAQLLRLANSEHFEGEEPVGGLRMALLRIGLNGLRELLLIASVGDVLVLPDDTELSRGMQLRATAVGLAAQGIARRIDLNDDAAFTAGILHDVGWPLAYGMMRAARHELPEALVRSKRLQHQLVEAVHELLGMELARAWGMPEHTALAIGNHHRPEGAAGARQLARCVCAARTVADAAGIVPEGEGDLDACSALAGLGLGDATAREVFVELRRRMGLLGV